MRISLQDFLDCCFDAQISPAWPDWDSISTILRDTDQEGHSDGIERGEAGDAEAVISWRGARSVFGWHTCRDSLRACGMIKESKEVNRCGRATARMYA